MPPAGPRRAARSRAIDVNEESTTTRLSPESGGAVRDYLCAISMRARGNCNRKATKSAIVRQCNAFPVALRSFARKIWLPMHVYITTQKGGKKEGALCLRMAIKLQQEEESGERFHETAT
uniref:Uncharacterized protein n=1 Tax=Plectus sambesii TaxID=2011161 RepID=A0A914XNS2_9BILA